jgi:predicted DNA-binding transcriptional regulator AlpA
MTDTYLSDTDIAKRYNIARPTVWRWNREQPGFPPPIRLTPGCTRWKLADIEAWEQSQVEVA